MERLSKVFEIPYYKGDDYEICYIKNANFEDQPTMFVYTQLDWDEIWSRPVELQVCDKFVFHQEDLRDPRGFP